MHLHRASPLAPPNRRSMASSGPTPRGDLAANEKVDLADSAGMPQDPDEVPHDYDLQQKQLRQKVRDH